MLAYVLEQLDLLCCMSASLDLGLLEFIRPNVDKCDLRTHACFHHLTSVFLVIRSTQILSLFVRLLAAFGVQLLSVWKHTTSGLPVAAVLRASLLFFSRSPPVENIARRHVERRRKGGLEQRCIVSELHYLLAGYRDHTQGSQYTLW